MKSIFAFLLVCSSFAAFAQKDTMAPAYKRYPMLPALQLLLSDSTTKYTKDNVPKNKPVLLMIFNPDCEHCQHEAEQIVANKEALKKIHIIMATNYTIAKMNAFGDTYGLNKMDNVVLAKDPYYILPVFYQMHNMPYLALYDKKGNLITTYEGSVGIQTLLTAFNKAK